MQCDLLISFHIVFFNYLNVCAADKMCVCNNAFIIDFSLAANK